MRSIHLAVQLILGLAQPAALGIQLCKPGVQAIDLLPELALLLLPLPV